MAEPGSKIVNVLLDRLYATLVNGPLLSCRPHSSRQRVDLMQLAKLRGATPAQILAALLGPDRSIKLSALADMAEVSEPNGKNGDTGDELRGLASKLRTIAEDARTYEEETGTQALFLGFPLLNLPPDANLGSGRAKKRILAPLAFIPLRITIKATRPPSVVLEASGDGSELVIPNTALIAWVERSTGKDLGELYADDEAKDPWGELNAIVSAVLGALDLPAHATLSADSVLVATPRSDAEDAPSAGVVQSAVLGLFPAANQGLLNDLEALADGAPADGPIESFLKAHTDLGALRNPKQEPSAQGAEPTTSLAGSERCIAHVDPCQARAVHLARKVNGLVIHGPPGTGKSQTITNIIGDHLANGERVLFVCDKRTALDVVAHRLDHLGLASLCAVVYDARRDQRDLYRSIREQLDTLAETQGDASSVAALARVDAELGRIHAELTEHDRALTDRPNGTAPSFHELVGQWLAVRVPTHAAADAELPVVPLAELLPLESSVKEAAERGLREAYSDNPWTKALGAELDPFMATPHAAWQTRLQRLVDAAAALDALSRGAATPFSPSGDVREEGRALRTLGELLQTALELTTAETLVQWLTAAPESVQGLGVELDAAEPYVQLVKRAPDRELALALGTGPSPSELSPWLSKLGAYVHVARKWYAFFMFGRRAAAREVIERFGLALNADTAQRATAFLERVRARQMLHDVVTQLTAPSATASPPPTLGEAQLTKAVAGYAAILRVIRHLDAAPALASTAPLLRTQLAQVAESQQTLETLLAAESHAAGIAEFESAAHALGLLNVDKLGDLAHAARRAEPVLPLVQSLQRRLGTVEGLLRIAALLERLDANTSRLVRRLLDEGATPETAWTVVKAAALQAEVQRRLRDQPVLLRTDGARVESSHSRYRELNLRRRELVRDVVRQRWISNQRERLLASTGSRLNSLGAEIRRRLVTRGERAMRVRQMIQAGNAIEGGDPLFVLRPVWMASPDVVAQIFPRQALFDVVIFDEASQCRLEEALPVLLRARRVVIAGDPQQLPPTRFFESGVAQSQQQQSEDEQSLFEAQQSEVEDLLGAALNLSVEQAYLDVHYRSRNADLIAFSNANFYDSRLQPIPAHPSSRAKLPPLRLIPAKGVYDKRSNPTEALEVVKIVKRLLSEAHPPSIGIACFNITQRDEIVEALDLAAAQDHHFAAQLAVARMRKGEASSEALFVRNLENVQGDERDHMIISTTFGPDPHGRFYRRFGPLGQAGGGRRLNVLVTRAREMVHLVTSIPPGVYNSRPEIPSGASPSGGWLLFSYLAYAEWLERAYAEEQQHHGQSESASSECHVLDTKYPSEFARALGELLASEHAIGSQVHWGNDGFAVDAALQHPEREDDVTIGVLCDGSRFAKAADRVQWDIFRTEVLEGQRWRLQRIWSPQLFRDPEGTIAQLIRKREEWLREEADAKRTAELAKRADMQMLN